MANTYLAGSNGRVRYGAGNTIMAGPYSWKVEKKTGEVDNTNFESTADSNSVIHADFITDNIADSMLTIESVIDHGSVKTETIFPIGTTVLLDLLYDKTSGEGYNNVSAFVKGYTPGISIRDKQSTNIICRVIGVMPAT